MPRGGEIVHAWETWAQAGGGGAVAALQLARLGARRVLFTALGDDELGRRARESCEAARGSGARLRSRPSPSAARSATSTSTASARSPCSATSCGRAASDGELPWEELERADAVYFVSGDAAALRQARRARVLVATARELATLEAGGVELDALVGSGEDDGERYQPGDLDPPPELVVSTSGALGGWAQPGGPYQAVAPPGRSRTPTAAATASRPGSPTRSARGLAPRGRARIRARVRRGGADRPRRLRRHVE